MENIVHRFPRPTVRGRALSPTRAWILDLVEGASEPPSTADLVRATGLHENTVRAHLEALHDRGYLARDVASTPQRGRPAHHWRAQAPNAANADTARPQDAASARAYAELTGILTSALGRQSGNAADDARAAGQAWGREHPITGGALPSIMRNMGHLGFSPSYNGGRGNDRSTIALHACPLFAAVQRDAAVVCAAHRGMIEGMLQATGSTPNDAPDNSINNAVLIPFSSPGVCTVILQ
ncbi:MAG TPA: helix-turn-helix domain-containing protein [Microbacteriaceae bacterium]|nr:helix-turn-helix domain-containing protein [Microbacteriaceae bacterium]